MMWLAFYNENVGDVLLLTRGGGVPDDFIETESQGNVTLIKDRRSSEVVSANIFNMKDAIKPANNGNITLTEADLEWVNEQIQAVGFDLTIDVDNTPKFVVGYVEEVEAHEDSDHLSITQTDIGDEVVQIVCGASNIDEDQYVIVAKPGAVMPNGAIIWPGELRGEASNGMICSTSELGLSDIDDMPGIWELEDEFEPGTPLEEVVSFYRG
ncbi:tRNA-binding protein [Suicoccus acidiformans]|uniref:tRNA-binding protein n=2 Tax=Suicoccus acidiformans TaxID=2036206 RepID=A0A347WJ57_9LACT|nr:tRNA-binding protein [Suicoccus acidiformans]